MQGGMRSCQEALGQMETSVCPQWPGPQKDVPHQIPNWNDLPDVLQRVLLANSPRRCWALVPSGNHTVHGLVQWSWSKRSMGASGSAFTSWNWTNGASKMPTHYPTLMRPSTAHRGPNGSPCLTWSLGTGRSRLTRRAKYWPHLLWGHWDSMSAI